MKRWGRMLRQRLAAPPALLALVAAQVLTNVWYIAQQKAGNPNPGDEAAHTIDILAHYYRGVASLRDAVYPPFTAFVSIVLHHLLGTSFQVSVLANAPFLLALVAGVYGIAFRLTKSFAAGLFAAVLVSCYPMIALLSRMVMFEFPTAGMVALAVWLLLETEGFSRRDAAVLFGLVCGLGQLTRESFAVFVIGPVIAEIVRGLAFPAAEHAPRRMEIVVNILAATALALLLPVLWYAHDPGPKLTMARLSATLHPNHPEIRFFSRLGLLFYPYTVLDWSVSVWLSLPIFAALPAFFRHASPQRWAILGWIVVPWLFFSNLDWKLARYLTAMLPALAVLTAVGLFSIRTAWLRVSLIAATTLSAVFVWTALTFGIAPQNLVIETGLPAYVTGIRLALSAGEQDIHVGPPTREPWPLEEIGALIARAARLPGGATAARFLNQPDWRRTHPMLYENQLNFPLEYVIVRDRLAAELLDFYFDDQGAIAPLWPERGYTAEKDLPKAVLLISTGPDLPRLLQQENRWALIRKFTDRGVEKNVYCNTDRVSPAYFQTP